ncbi:MAG: energy transducer TonB [Desulfomonilaceae bacterium]
MDIHSVVFTEFSHGLNQSFVFGHSDKEIANDRDSNMVELPSSLDDSLGQLKKEIYGKHLIIFPEPLTDELSLLNHHDSFNADEDEARIVDDYYGPSLSDSDNTINHNRELDRLIPYDYSSVVNTKPCKFSEALYSNLLSTIAHIIVIFSISYAAHAGAIGQQGVRKDTIFVSLVDTQSPIVQVTSRSTAASALSAPSIANRSLSYTGKNLHNDEKDIGNVIMATQIGEATRTEEFELKEVSRVVRLSEQESIDSPRPSRNDSVYFVSKSNQDSMSSLPSTAQEERRSASTRGDQINEFKLKLLAAIHEAAYFPKRALHSKKFGEALVSFTVVNGGQLEDLRIDQSSGSEILDDAALDILKKASSSFPEIPSNLSQKKLSYVIPITFRK